MQQMTLCGRCAEVLRSRYIVRLTYRDVNVKIDCDVCKRLRWGGTYDVTPKRGDKREQSPV